MKRISIFFYSIRQGLKSLYRNRMFSLASIGTIMTCLFLFGIFYFIICNFHYMVVTAESSVGITVFFKKGTTDDKIKEIGEKISSKEEVEQIKFISAEEAWEQAKEKMFKGREELIERFQNDNPLADSASYEVHLNDVSKQKLLVKYIEKIEGVRQVNNSDSTAESLSSLNLLIGYISAGIIIILIAVAVFLINTTIAMGISIRQEEIAIMKLIGATDYFIRAPFIVEGIVIGLVGSIVPLTILYFLYDKVIVYISTKFRVLSDVLVFLDVNHVFLSFIPISLGIGIGIGLLGSYITIRKHLKV